MRMDARVARANMRAALHIQHRRPNDRAYRAPNWNKHSLGQWEELMGVGDPECALMRAQTCAQPCTSSICGQTAGPIGAQRTLIGTMGSSYGGRRSPVRSTTHTALAPEGLERLNPKLVQKTIGAMGTSHWGRRARSARSAQSERRSRPCAERENEREALE
jgi:hypothetical protein